jgi:GH25 family lysozyme M1 (1,4-beta-N-acetylmuramidase)
LQGADTSHWQSDAEFAASIKNAKWTAIKATQGTSFVDKSFNQRWNMLGQKVQSGDMKLRIAYLFLDPGNGTGQAKHFLDTLGIHGKLQPGTRLALDWEAAALNSPSTLRDAANYIHKVTGLWPLIYVQASKLSVAKATVPEAPIWEAAWNHGKIKTDVPFFQYSNGPGHDHDVFNGDENALKRFAGWA